MDERSLVKNSHETQINLDLLIFFFFLIWAPVF